MSSEALSRPQGTAISKSPLKNAAKSEDASKEYGHRRDTKTDDSSGQSLAMHRLYSHGFLPKITERKSGEK